MTTNVIDLLHGTFACDSRWSCDGSDFVLYVDDTGFEKISVKNGIALIFAGHGGIIQMWKDWLKAQPNHVIKRPPTVIKEGGIDIGISLCMVRCADKRVLFTKDQLDSVPNALFAGSGKVYAMRCWSGNQNARQAVRSAISMDIRSGGTVRYLEFETGDSNVRDTTDIKGVDKKLVTEGKVVSVSNCGFVSVPVSEAEKTNPEVKKLVDKVKNNEIAATAPCDSMYLSWTEDDLARLDTAILEAFGPANQA